jgi:type I restriction enzyme S subunit
MAMELDELPDGWKQKPLSDPGVATLNPKKSEVSSLDARSEVTFVPMSAVDDGSGTIARPEVRRLGEVKKGYTYFKEGDVIFAKITPCMENGKSAIARRLRNGIGFGSTEFHVVRAGPETQPEWLHLILRSQQVRDDAENAMHGAAGQQRVPIEFLQQLEIPVPPLAEQRRIVARVEALTRRLDQARQARQAALDEAENMLAWIQQSSYERLLEEHDSIPLSGVGEVVSGNTPSKARGEFWDGEIPWVAPKEMKVFRIGKSSMNVTKLAVTEGGAKIVPKPAVLMVVRGMILAKRVPVAVTTQPLTINQDMKAFTPRKGIEPEFLANMLCGAGDELKGRVAIAGHGTCKLESEEWGSLQIPIPPPEKQRAVVAKLNALRGKLDELQRLQREVEAELASFTPALLAKAFRGEL